MSFAEGRPPRDRGLRGAPSWSIIKDVMVRPEARPMMAAILPGNEVMEDELVAQGTAPALAPVGIDRLPHIITAAGEGASRRFVEFFVATIRNRNTRHAYARAVRDFLAWCE